MSRKCKATARSGKPCGNLAMNGQEVCHRHGGASPQARRAAERRIDRAEALALAERMASEDGRPDRDPVAHVVDELRSSERVVAALGDELASGGDPLDAEGRAYQVLHLWRAERRHLGDLAVLAARLGIEERQTRVAEAQGATIVAVIRATLADLGQPTGEARVAETLARHLRAVAAPRTRESVVTAC